MRTISEDGIVSIVKRELELFQANRMFWNQMLGTYSISANTYNSDLKNTSSRIDKIEGRIDNIYSNINDLVSNALKRDSVIKSSFEKILFTAKSSLIKDVDKIVDDSLYKCEKYHNDFNNRVKHELKDTNITKFHTDIISEEVEKKCNIKIAKLEGTVDRLENALLLTAVGTVTLLGIMLDNSRK